VEIKWQFSMGLCTCKYRKGQAAGGSESPKFSRRVIFWNRGLKAL